LARETARAVAGLKEDVAAVRRQEAELEGNLQGMASRFGRAGEAAVRLSQLEREADASRAIYESFLGRYKETIEQEGLTMPEARLLSAAEPPAKPTGSGRLPATLFGLLTGLALGSLLAAFRERIDERVRDIIDVERVAAAPVMGVLPEVARWRPAPELQVSRFNRTPFGEAIQRTGAALRLPRAPLRARVIMVTSAAAREGKTSFCTALARFLAMSDRRVLVIDADFRRPRLAKAFGLAERADTQNVIHGTVNLAEGVQADPRSGAHVLTALAEPGALHSHLQGPGWDALVARAREQYDVVILDTPPVTAASDAGVIGACADVNLFLVRWGRSTRSGIVSAIRFLNLCGLTVDGVVLTRTKARRAPPYLTTYGQGPGGLHTLSGEARTALGAPTAV
jgi:Mrp family chromosome partitioning ATPase